MTQPARLREANPAPLGAAIRSARRRALLTQRELAQLLSVSVNAVSDWERGVSTPRAASLSGLADALGMQVSELQALAEAGPAVERLASVVELAPTGIQRAAIPSSAGEDAAADLQHAFKLALISALSRGTPTDPGWQSAARNVSRMLGVEWE